jgi:hypothetical protein
MKIEYKTFKYLDVKYGHTLNIRNAYLRKKMVETIIVETSNKAF